MIKKHLILILSFLIWFILFPKWAYASDAFELVSLTKSGDVYEIEARYISSDSLDCRIKIGVSLDQSSYSLSSTYSETTDSYLSYSSAWNSAPLKSLSKDDPIKIIFKINDSTVSTGYIRFRYRDENTQKTYNIDYSSLIDFKNENSENLLENITYSDDSSAQTELLSENSSDSIYSESSGKLTKDQIKNILINEFMPNPDEEEEWIEIINKNDTLIKLNNWYIDDFVGKGSSPVVFSCEIKGKSNCLVSLKTSILNNSGEEAVSLLDDSKNVLQQVNYTKTIKGSSIQKLSNGKWYITEKNTKGKENLTYEDFEKYEMETVKESLEENNPPSDLNEEATSDERSITENNEVLGISAPLSTPDKYFESEYVDLNVITMKQEESLLDIIFKFFRKAYFRDQVL